jgi:hypothetical protein
VPVAPFQMAPRLLSYSQLRPAPAQAAGTHPTTLAGGVRCLPTALYFPVITKDHRASDLLVPFNGRLNSERYVR